MLRKNKDKWLLASPTPTDKLMETAANKTAPNIKPNIPLDLFSMAKGGEVVWEVHGFYIPSPRPALWRGYSSLKELKFGQIRHINGCQLFVP